MKQGIYTVESVRPLAKSTYEMVLNGDTSAFTAPGQFLNIRLSGKFLRRPISVCSYEADALHIIFKTVGAGTEQLSRMNPGETLDILTGLGNGYDLSPAGDSPLLIGGGAGVPPMYGLAQAFLQKGIVPTVLLGFNTAEEVFYEEKFTALGAQVIVATADGSVGEKGFVTDVMPNLSYTYFYTCGPEPMLRAIDRIAVTSGQLSFEERMGCGFGACMGCSCKTKYGNKRICKDGPVLRREEIIW